MNQSDFSLIIPIRRLRELSLSLDELSTIKAQNIILVYDDADEEDFQPFFHLTVNVTFVRADAPHHVGQAIYKGILSAKTEKVIVTMGDGCDSWIDIPQIVNLLDRFDLVNTTRFKEKNGYIGGNVVKKWVTCVGAYLLEKRWGWSISDPTNNFKGYRREIFSRLGPIESSGFSVGLEILVKAHIHQLKIIEIPSQWRDSSSSYQWIKRVISYLYCFFIKKEKVL